MFFEARIRTNIIPDREKGSRGLAGNERFRDGWQEAKSILLESDMPRTGHIR